MWNLPPPDTAPPEARSRLARMLVAHHLAQLLGHGRVGEDAVGVLALVEAVLARELAAHALLVIRADGWRIWVLLSQRVLRNAPRIAC